MIEELKIEITSRCGRGCIHCSSNASESQVKELDYNDVKRILLEAKQLGIKSIVFTGGEPCLYDKIQDLIIFAKKLSFIVKLYSFLPRTKDSYLIYAKLLSLGIDELVYSLADDLTKPNIKNEQSYESFFCDLFKINSHCKLSFHYVLLDKHINTLNNINNIIQIFKDKDYFKNIKILRFVAHGRGDNSMIPTKDDYLVFREFYLFSPYQDYIKLGSPWNLLNIGYKPCKLAEEVMIIGYDGIAYPCDSLKYFNNFGVSGNIKEKSLDDLYHSDYFQRLRLYKYTDKCIKECLGQKLLNVKEEL